MIAADWRLYLGIVNDPTFPSVVVDAKRLEPFMTVRSVLGRAVTRDVDDITTLAAFGDCLGDDLEALRMEYITLALLSEAKAPSESQQRQAAGLWNEQGDAWRQADAPNAADLGVHLEYTHGVPYMLSCPDGLLVPLSLVQPGGLGKDIDADRLREAVARRDRLMAVQQTIGATVWEVLPLPTPLASVDLFLDSIEPMRAAVFNVRWYDELITQVEDLFDHALERADRLRDAISEADLSALPVDPTIIPLFAAWRSLAAACGRFHTSFAFAPLLELCNNPDMKLEQAKQFGEYCGGLMRLVSGGEYRQLTDAETKSLLAIANLVLQGNAAHPHLNESPMLPGFGEESMLGCLAARYVTLSIPALEAALALNEAAGPNYEPGSSFAAIIERCPPQQCEGVIGELTTCLSSLGKEFDDVFPAAVLISALMENAATAPDPAAVRSCLAKVLTAGNMVLNRESDLPLDDLFATAANLVRNVCAEPISGKDFTRLIKVLGDFEERRKGDDFLEDALALEKDVKFTISRLIAHIRSCQ